MLLGGHRLLNVIEEDAEHMDAGRNDGDRAFGAAPVVEVDHVILRIWLELSLMMVGS